mmetsp:Transcript_5936/g.12111  ORF Transcript_5936/g.12111 Transcript_5936/m.12111 type:complete len:483 (+) Transcript_5936:35-1483(+)
MTTDKNSKTTSNLDKDENVDIVGKKTLNSCPGAITDVVTTLSMQETPLSPKLPLQQPESRCASKTSESAVDAGDGEFDHLETNDHEVLGCSEERNSEVKPEISCFSDQNEELKIVNDDVQLECSECQNNPGRIVSSAEVANNLEVLEPSKKDGSEPSDVESFERSAESLKESKNHVEEDDDDQSTLSTSFVNVELAAFGDLGDEAVNHVPTKNATTDHDYNDSIDPNEPLQISFHNPNEQFAGQISDHDPVEPLQGIPHPNEQFTHHVSGDFSPDPSQGKPRRKILHHPLLSPLSKIPWSKMINVSNACDAIFNCKYSMRQVEDEVRRENMIMNSSDYVDYHAEIASGFEGGGNQFCGGIPFEENEEDGCAETDFVEMGLECCSMLDNDYDEDDDGDGVLEEPKKEPNTMDSHQTNSQSNRGRGNDDAANETEPLISQTFHTWNNNPSTISNLLSPEQKADIHWRNMKPSADMILYRQFYEE